MSIENLRVLAGSSVDYYPRVRIQQYVDSAVKEIDKLEARLDEAVGELKELAVIRKANEVLAEHNDTLQTMFAEAISCLEDIDEDDVPENTFRHILIALKQKT